MNKKLIFAFVFLFLILSTEIYASCTENWQCTPTTALCDWKSGDHVRDCVDTNNCGTTNSKPEEEAFWYKISEENTPTLSRIIVNVTVFSGNSPLSSTLEYYPCDDGYYAETKGIYKFGQCCPDSGWEDCELVYPRVDIVTGNPYDKKTLTVGESWNLGTRITLTVNSIDAKANPRQAWLTLFKDGIKLDDKVVAQGQYYYYTEKSMCGETDISSFGTYVDSIFAGAVDDMIELKYTYVNKHWWSCSETWECGDWGYCIPGVDPQQSRGCIDIYTCGTTASKPSTIRPCCAENWQCSNWSACIDGQQIKNCIEANNCDTTYNKPAITQSCTSCIENWQCNSWSECANNQQTRTCIDSSSCGTIATKPITAQICTACIEDWQCGSWSACTNGQQTRDCTDLNKCGTITNKPLATQNCTATGCTESWFCSPWLNCENEQQTRICIDLYNCGTEFDKPVMNKPCTSEPSTCTESWSCDEWAVCSNGQQTRNCADDNGCGTTINKPVINQDCSVDTNPDLAENNADEAGEDNQDPALSGQSKKLSESTDLTLISTALTIIITVIATGLTATILWFLWKKIREGS